MRPFLLAFALASLMTACGSDEPTGPNKGDGGPNDTAAAEVGSDAPAQVDVPGPEVAVDAGPDATADAAATDAPPEASTPDAAVADSAPEAGPDAAPVDVPADGAAVGDVAGDVARVSCIVVSPRCDRHEDCWRLCLPRSDGRDWCCQSNHECNSTSSGSCFVMP